MWRVLFLTLIVANVACADRYAEATGNLSDPLPGLSDTETAQFRAGAAIFDRDFTESEGLGPLFNDKRCSSCHDIPSLGGNGSEVVRKATRFDQNRCDLLVRYGGDMLQDRATEALRAKGVLQDPVPPIATAIVHIQAPALFGAGLIETIPDETIMKGEDPDDRNGDGISGRGGRTFDGRLGRFGRKATFADLLSFTQSALHGEMGITTRSFPKEEPPGGQPLPEGTDPAPDPELSDTVVEQITNFVRLLAAPQRERPANSAARDSIRFGEQVFVQIGCAACHTPVLRTGDSPIPALHRKTVRLYSDLLVHDLGPEMASVCAPNALPSEWRTSPLMGLRFRLVFLHDRRTSNLDGAIRAHGGEAERSRDHFLVLPPEQRALLLRFLRSL
jgi:CxxC motif-containing protein (DUF1111 family)